MHKPIRPELTIQPNTSSPFELAWSIIRDAELCQLDSEEKGKFRAMDLHTWFMDLCDDHPYVAKEARDLGLLQRLYENQARLGII